RHLNEVNVKCMVKVKKLKRLKMQKCNYIHAFGNTEFVVRICSIGLTRIDNFLYEFLSASWSSLAAHLLCVGQLTRRPMWRWRCTSRTQYFHPQLSREFKADYTRSNFLLQFQSS